MAKFQIPPNPIPPAHQQEPVFAKNKPWLAPLAGYSDLPFRLLCREYGAAVCETEMISAKGLIYGTLATSQLLASMENDQPLIVQLFGAEADILAETVRRLRQAGYNYFDLNVGCPVRKVLRQKAGAALLGDAKTLLDIANAMIGEVKKTLPHMREGKIGFKLRLGLEHGKPAGKELALMLQDAGADWIAFHPRYASQGYSGQADWDATADVASQLSIPLVASGDLTNGETGVKCLSQTGADTLMYARGALQNPAIFREHENSLASSPITPSTGTKLLQILKRHIELTKKFSPSPRAFFKMRSIAPRYMRFFPGCGNFRKEINACGNWDELELLVENLFVKNNSGEI